MTEDGGYDLTPDEPARGAVGAGKPKPGEPGWVEPKVVIEKAEGAEEKSGEGEEDGGGPPDPDVEKHKGLALLGYICFLIPLVAASNSPFAKYHANQGLLAFLVGIAGVVFVVVLQVGMMVLSWLLSGRVDILYYFFSCIFQLLQAAALVGWVALAIVGIINAANGLKKPLPVVGHWVLIK